MLLARGLSLGLVQAVICTLLVHVLILDGWTLDKFRTTESREPDSAVKFSPFNPHASG